MSLVFRETIICEFEIYQMFPSLHIIQKLISQTDSCFIITLDFKEHSQSQKKICFLLSLLYPFSGSGTIGRDDLIFYYLSAQGYPKIKKERFLKTLDCSLQLRNRCLKVSQTKPIFLKSFPQSRRFFVKKILLGDSLR